jgi:hypothetical protein
MQAEKVLISFATLKHIAHISAHSYDLTYQFYTCLLNLPYDLRHKGSRRAFVIVSPGIIVVREGGKSEGKMCHKISPGHPARGIY